MALKENIIAFSQCKRESKNPLQKLNGRVELWQDSISLSCVQVNCDKPHSHYIAGDLAGLVKSFYVYLLIPDEIPVTTVSTHACNTGVEGH